MTHKKIAELAHTSPSTVSKALSGSTEISPELSREIRKIAMESGYFNEKTKRKREYTENRSLMIALIVPEIAGAHYPMIINCLKEEIESRGGTAAIYIFDFDPAKRERLIEAAIISGSTDGMIIISPPAFTAKPAIPTVGIASRGSAFCDTVGTDAEKLMCDTILYLKGLGHTKIGFVGEYNTVSKANDFRAAMHGAGLEPDEDFIYTVNDRFEAIGIKAAESILSTERRPTAVVAAYDEIAYGLIHTLTKNGIRIPDELSVIGINNIPTADYVQIPLTSVDVFSREQYRIAAELLFEKIFSKSAVIRHVTVQHKIIERQTTKRIDGAL